MIQLDPAVEQQLADMSDDDWRALSTRVRPPITRPGDAGKAAADKRFGQKGTQQ